MKTTSIGACGAILILFLPVQALAQEEFGCDLEARTGVRMVGENPPVATGAPLQVMGSALALTFGGTCQLAPRFIAGVSAETSLGSFQDVHQLLMGKAGLSLVNARPGGSRYSGAIWLLGGWAFADQGARATHLLTPTDTAALESQSTGPAVGTSIGLALNVSPRLDFALDARWRASFFEVTNFDGIGERSGSDREAIHTFPVTAGFKLRL